jgi:hypothetical protein
VFPAPFSLQAREDIEEVEEEEDNDLWKDEEFIKAKHDHSGKVPYTIELNPWERPADEFKSAVKVLENSNNIPIIWSSLIGKIW